MRKMEEIGSVNLVKIEEGKTTGYNVDIAGIAAAFANSNIDFKAYGNGCPETLGECRYNRYPTRASADTFTGYNVTSPHKVSIMKHLDFIVPEACS